MRIVAHERLRNMNAPSRYPIKRWPLTPAQKSNAQLWVLTAAIVLGMTLVALRAFYG